MAVYSTTHVITIIASTAISPSSTAVLTEFLFSPISNHKIIEMCISKILCLKNKRKLDKSNKGSKKV